MKAVQENDVEALKKMKEEGVKVTTLVCNEARCMLHISCGQRGPARPGESQYHLCQPLIPAFPIGARSLALHEAARVGDSALECVRYLLDQRANAHATEKARKEKGPSCRQQLHVSI